MAAQPENAATTVAAEPLGAVLVKRGLITDQQLAAALEEQRVTGDQLGSILVARGFATPALVAQALATQSGKVLKTEYGFATGFGTGRTQAPGETPQPPPVSVRSARAVESDRRAARAELELAAAETSRVSEANERLVTARADLEKRLASEAQRAAALERELVELRAAPAASQDVAAYAQLEHALTQWQAAYAELEQRLAQATEQVTRLQGEAVARDGSFEEHRASASALEAALAQLEAGLAREVDRASTLAEQLSAAEQRLASAESSDSIHAELEQQLQQLAGQLRAAESAREELEAAQLAQATEVRAELEQRTGELEQRLAQATEQVTRLQGEAAERDASFGAARAELQAGLAYEAHRASTLAEQLSAAEQRLASAESSDSIHAELEQQLQQLAGQLRAAESAREELEAAQLAQATEYAAGLAALAAEGDALRHSALTSQQAAGELEHRLDAVRVELELRAGELEQLHAAAEASQWAGVHAHLVFFRGPNGYELVERSGPPPGAGSQVELSDLPAQIVSRIGRSPFPGSALPCVYLVAG